LEPCFRATASQLARRLLCACLRCLARPHWALQAKHLSNVSPASNQASETSSKVLAVVEEVAVVIVAHATVARVIAVLAVAVRAVAVLSARQTAA